MYGKTAISVSSASLYTMCKNFFTKHILNILHRLPINYYMIYNILYEQTAKILNCNIRNMHQVCPGIFRSGQPTAKNFQELDRLGIKSVLNLRNILSDRRKARKTSLSLYRVRMRAGKICDRHIIEAIKVILNAPKPLLVHCRRGSDRTGVVIALYRIVVDGWDKDRALNELLRDEYGHQRWLYPNIIEYILNVDIEKIINGVYSAPFMVKQQAAV